MILHSDEVLVDVGSGLVAAVGPAIMPDPPTPPAPDPHAAFHAHVAACRRCGAAPRDPNTFCAMGAELLRLAHADLAASAKAHGALPPNAGALLEHATVALVHDFYNKVDQYGSRHPGLPGTPRSAVRVSLNVEGGYIMSPTQESGSNGYTLHAEDDNGRSTTFLPAGHYRAVFVLLPIAPPASPFLDEIAGVVR